MHLFTHIHIRICYFATQQAQCKTCDVEIKSSFRIKFAGYNRLLATSGKTIMECTVRWTGASGMTFLAETGSGHVVAMDGAPDGGGRNLAPRPMEMVLLGTGGCTAYDVVLILRKSGQKISNCDVKLTAERAEKEPKVFTKVHFHFVVTGHQVKPNTVERAIKLSHEKYCSASIMMEKTAEITHSYEIVDEAVPASA
jgi:putative redox protein